MRITVKQLRRIINEEVSRVLREVNENWGENTIKIHCGEQLVNAIKGVSASIGRGRIGFENMGGGYDSVKGVLVGFGTAEDINEFKNTVMEFFEIPDSDIEIGPGPNSVVIVLCA